jgi:hypothetical protein
MARGSYEGLARFATIFAIVFGVSLGLCGTTVFIGGLSRTGDSLLPLALLEGAGMAVGALGLIVAGLWALFQFVASLISRDKDLR